MAKTYLLNLMIEVPDEEQYPENFIMTRLMDCLAYKDKDHFWNEFQVDMEQLRSKAPNVEQS